MTKLADADAFSSLAMDRRAALWQALGQERRARHLPLLENLEHNEPLAPLPPMPLVEQVFADYRTSGMSLKAHPVGFFREQLNKSRVTPAGELEKIRHGRHLRVAGSDAGSARNFEQLRMIAAWMHSMPQVQAAAETGCIQKPNSTPVATTSSMTTNDADILVCAYWRSSSVSKAGRVPLVDVNRSRASRTRCADARRALTGAAGAGSAGSWTTSGFSAGLLIRQHNCARELRGLLHHLSVALNV